jgi:C1A family cysteine protease
MQRKYGWKKGPEDSRDLLFGAGKPVLGLPTSVDLSPLMPSVYDQGNTSSCTGQATAAAIHYAMKFAKIPDFAPSRLFPYYNARILEQSTAEDTGAVIRDVLKGLSTYGFVPETDWPFEANRVTSPPPVTTYGKALANRIKLYATIPVQQQALKLSLVHGFPVIIGMQVFPYFESQQMGNDGFLKSPGIMVSGECIGGHAVLLCGYDDNAECFLVRNSWGEGWGLKSHPGYFQMPYRYAETFCSDAWMLRLSDFYNKSS